MKKLLFILLLSVSCLCFAHSQTVYYSIVEENEKVLLNTIIRDTVEQRQTVNSLIFSTNKELSAYLEKQIIQRTELFDKIKKEHEQYVETIISLIETIK